MSGIPFDPCGCGVDWINQPFRAKIKPYKDRPDLVEVQWYFCRPTAKPLPFRTVFGCLAWSATDIRADTTPGQVDGTLKTIPAPGPVTRSPGIRPYGPAAYFLGEAPGPDGTKRTTLGEALQCLLQPRGWLIGGRVRMSGRPLRGKWLIGGRSTYTRRLARFGRGGWRVGGRSTHTTSSARIARGGWRVGGFSLANGTFSRAGIGGWLVGGFEVDTTTSIRAGIGGWLLGGHSLAAGTFSRAGIGGWLIGGFSAIIPVAARAGIGGWLIGGFEAHTQNFGRAGIGGWLIGGLNTHDQGSDVLTGTILLYPATTAPAGYLLCNGGTFDSGTYPDLATFLGDKFGAHSGTTYHLPDLRGRVPVGAGTGSGLSARAINDSGGLEAVQLTAAESGIGAHTHGSIHGLGFLENALSGGGIIAGTPVAALQTSSTTANNTAEDATVTHENMQPWRCVGSYIIKT